jgi:hypothetical protein
MRYPVPPCVDVTYAVELRIFYSTSIERLLRTAVRPSSHARALSMFVGMHLACVSLVGFRIQLYDPIMNLR